jgi:hypothetical protein
MSDSKLSNIYCDDSCHLENDGQNAMVLDVISASVADRRVSTRWGFEPSKNPEVE